MNKNIKHKAFTLVELIVVITILAVLATIAFISFQWYAASSRDSVRLADMKSMEKVNTIFKQTTWKYPIPNDNTSITYSWSTAWIQWVFWQNSYWDMISMSNVPTDPLTQLPYAYSVTNTRQEYQMATVLENTISLNLNPQTYAWDQIWNVYVKWDYNGKFLKVQTGSLDYLLWVPSILTSDITSVDVMDIISNQKLVYKWYSNLPAVYSWSVYDNNWWFAFVPNQVVLFEWDINELINEPWERVTFLNNLQTNYWGTEIAVENQIEEILSVDSSSNSASSNYIANILNHNFKTKIELLEVNNWSSSVSQNSWIIIIEKNTCESTWWFWIEPENDILIWLNKWNWYCISPRIWDFWDANADWISWNWWWYYWWDLWYNGWDYTPYNITDDNIGMSNGWQTRNLLKVVDDIQEYQCLPLGTSSNGFTKNDNIDSINSTDDSLENRMRYLSKYRSNQNKLSEINWLNSISKPLGHQVYPAVYLADCIDWERNIGLDMLYTHNDGNIENISYSDYTISVSNATSVDLNNITYYKRQKYLTAWTQKIWSHLPSAFTYIWVWSTWWCNTWNCDPVTWNWIWEYQNACESWYLNDSNDLTDLETIWLAAIWNESWWHWWNNGRYMKYSCNDQSSNNWWAHDGWKKSARFVIR
jgi:prepilin-type N-terminal cleavage/methylation domain-containing protein